jgi:hypothetical protein
LRQWSTSGLAMRGPLSPFVFTNGVRVGVRGGRVFPTVSSTILDVESPIGLTPVARSRMTDTSHGQGWQCLVCNSPTATCPVRVA